MLALALRLPIKVRSVTPPQPFAVVDVAVLLENCRRYNLTITHGFAVLPVQHPAVVANMAVGHWVSVLTC